MRRRLDAPACMAWRKCAAATVIGVRFSLLSARSCFSARSGARARQVRSRSRSSRAFLPPPPLVSRRASTSAIDWTLRTKGTGEASFRPRTSHSLPSAASTTSGSRSGSAAMPRPRPPTASTPTSSAGSTRSWTKRPPRISPSWWTCTTMTSSHQTSPRIAIASWRSGRKLRPAIRVARTRSRSSSSTNPAASSTPPGTTSCSPRYRRSARPTRGAC